MHNWESKKLTEASLSEWVIAHMQTQGWGRERAFIAEYFGTQPHIVVEEYTGPYLHNISQFVMKRFFEEKKFFKKLVECHPDSSEQSAAVFEEISYDKDKSIRGYSEAAIGYETPDNKKVLVIVERQDETELHYRVLCPPEQGDLLKEWFAFAQKENLYRGKKLNAACQFLDLKDQTWDDVILPEGIKTLIRSMVSGAISKERLYLKNRLSLKRGIMFAGKPGNGKTSSMKAIASSVPISVIYAQPSHLMLARDVKHVCSMARDLSPCILFIEDIDWIAEDRDTGDAGRVIELMNQLDGLEEFANVITIASTNDLEKIEKAVKNRPGRFDRVIKIDDTDDDCRRRMVTLFTKDWQKSEIDVDRIVKFTGGLSGAHMSDLCRTAAVHALESGSLDAEEKLILRNEHFEAAIKEVKDKDYTTWMRIKSGGTRRRMGFGSEATDDDLD